MINQSQTYYDHTAQESREDGPHKDREIDREFEGVIGSTIEQAVSQYNNLLRQGLDIEVKRIIQEFESATAEIDRSIARRVRSRLAELVQEEVRRVFDDTLSNAEETIVDPIWARARDKHLSFITDYARQTSDRSPAPSRDDVHSDYDREPPSVFDRDA